MFNPGLEIGQVLKNADIVGKQVKHKAFGTGTIASIEGTSIVVDFGKVGLKKMGYEFCIEKKMLEFI